MSQRTLIALAICIMVVMGFLAVGSGGDRAGARLEALIEAQETRLASNQAQFASGERAVREALASDPELFRPQGYETIWPERLAEAKGRLEEAQASLTTAKTLFADSGAEQAQGIERELAAASAAAAVAQQAADEIATAARERVELKRNLPQELAEIEAAHKAVAAVSLTTLRGKVGDAGSDWPAKKADLDRRLGHLEQLVKETEEAWASVRSAADGGDNGIDYDAIAVGGRLLREHRHNLEAGLPRVTELVDQLYVSWDKLLADMEIREGETVTFHHLIRRSETATQAVDTESLPPKTEEEWKQVSEKIYKAREKDLGMTVAHKAAGLYDSEAVDSVQPAGYAYIASPQEQRNRYGEWRHRPGGGSFWVFYGQYSLMRNLFWGRGGYHGVYVNDYRRYDTARRSGRTWYGGDGTGKTRYGSSGTHTKGRYASSRHQRSGGYSNSKYVKTGGKYRGSRFERSRSTSRSRSSRGFGRSSRSRSFGGGRRSGGFGK
jgi:hypothetical protein